jgi:hypothetical protein
MPAEPIKSDSDMGILVGIHAQGDLHFDARTAGYLHVYFPPEIEGQQLAGEPRQGGHNCDQTFLVEGALL